MLSVCIPAYNYARYLAEAVDSCLAHEHPIQVVVVDNASTDETPMLRERYAGESRVKWLRNDQLLPVQANWNRAVSLADMPWIKVLQADDRLSRGAVDRLLEIISSDSRQSFHGHLAEVIDGTGRHLRWQRSYTADCRPVTLSPGEGLALKLRQSARLKEPTCNLYTRDAWSQVGGYPVSLRFTFDLSFNIKLLKTFRGTLWSEYLSQVRRHGESDGATLPSDLAIRDLRSLIDQIYHLMGSDITPSDRRAGLGWLQYRVIEMAAQRAYKQPLASAKFLVKHGRLLLQPAGWSSSLELLARRAAYGDVQRQI